MSLLWVVLAGFALALPAPWIERRTGRAAGWLLALLPAALTLYYASQIPAVSAGQARLFSMPWVPLLGINLSFHLDGLGLLFALIISGIGTLIVIYGGGYMEDHPQRGRFFAFILMFMASMLGVVTADNMVTLFIFWELTSISSYLLIGFDHGRLEARKAALQALLVTGGGGLGLLAAAILLPMAAGSAELSTIIAGGVHLGDHPLYGLILALVLLAAFTKSAQWPFHFWLPGAMQAPTPVSAYLHSATMVKAGIYLLARLSPVLGGTPSWQLLLGGFGAATMLAGAFLALQRTDTKQILAYSTVSVLGTLTFLLGLGGEKATAAMVVYLTAHSCYKGALFLVAGNLDHGTGTRDVARLGLLWRAMPLTAAAAALAGLSMAGVPPLIGYIGKELLLEAALSSPWRLAATVAVVLAAAATVAIAMIIALGPFWRRAPLAPPHAHPHEAGPSLWLGPALLGAAGLALGLAPGLADRLLLGPATAAVRGEWGDMHLGLWHGMNLALGLSVLALVGGLVIYLAIGALRGAGERLAPLMRVGPARWYDWAIEGLFAVARAQTSVLQNGSLPSYIRRVLLVSISLAAWTMLAHDSNLGFWFDLSGIEAHEATVAVIIMLGWMLTLRAKTALTAVIGLGVVGYAVALIFMLFGAPDLAITQFSVETLVVILFVLVVYRLPRPTIYTTHLARLRDLAIAGAMGATVTMMILAVLSEPMESRLAPYFLSTALTEGHGRNVVNVILVDFRAFDTLGEIAVLGIAAFGVYILHRLRYDPEIVADRPGRRVDHVAAGRPGRVDGENQEGRP